MTKILLEMSAHKKINGKNIAKKRLKPEVNWKKGANTNSKDKEKAASSKHFSPIGGESYQKWFDTQFDEIRPEGSTMPIDELIQRAQKRGEELLSRDIIRFSQAYRIKNRADADWLDMVANRGTFPDRLSALQLRIHRSAVHALPQLRQFVQLAQRKGAKIRQAHTLTKALKELFLHDLLPPKRKLLNMAQRPLQQWVISTKPEADKRLMMWYFEAELKQLYHQFVEGLQSLAGNTAEGVALAACQDMAELLAERPEQEQQLLSALVNKLGHPTHRVGAGVAQSLERTVAQRHPNMRSVLIKEMEALLFRKNISPKAQLYAVHFLSRLILDAGEADLAIHMIRIYLKLFHILVSNDALAEHPKLLRLLISGLNRAFPYAKVFGRTSEVLDNVNSLYTIVQTAKFSTALSVLRLLFQIHSASDGLSDRFYAAFYRRLLNLQPGNQQHDSQLFTLAQQVLRNDLVECRVRAFLKRFFQIALSANSSFAAAILLMCYSIVRERPQLIKVAKTNEGETIKAEQQKFDEVDEDEHYDDVKLKDDDGQGPKKEEEEEEGQMDNEKRRRKRGWMHRREMVGTSATASTVAVVQKHENGILVPSPVKRQRKMNNGATKAATTTTIKNNNFYNSMARNPLFAGAEWALDNELTTLSHHFHPTVASFAQALCKGHPISYRGDPLIDLSQMRFLDRFAFKNPKKQRRNLPMPAGDDGTENAGGGTVPSLFAHSYAPSGVKALNPTSQDYLSKKNSEIPLDERFLHHFAKIKFQKEGAKAKRKDEEQKDDDDVASLDSDEFDTLMERFEPGESREIFDVDFGTEFDGKARKNGGKRLKQKRTSASMLMGESDEEEEDDDLGDDDQEGEDDDDEFEDDEIDEDGDEEDDDSGSEDEEDADGVEYDDEFDDGTDGDDEEEEDELEFE